MGNVEVDETSALLSFDV